jgi:hypothetical protein
MTLKRIKEMRNLDKDYCDVCGKEIRGTVLLTNEKTYCMSCGLEKQIKDIATTALFELSGTGTAKPKEEGKNE